MKVNTDWAAKVNKPHEHNIIHMYKKIKLALCLGKSSVNAMYVFTAADRSFVFGSCPCSGQQ